MSDFVTHECGRSISSTVPICPGCGEWSAANAVGARKRAAGVVRKGEPIYKAIGESIKTTNEAIEASAQTRANAWARYEHLRKSANLSHVQFAATPEGAAAIEAYYKAQPQPASTPELKKSAADAVEKAWADLEAAHVASGKSFVEFTSSPEAAPLVEAYRAAKAGAQ